MYFEWIHIDGSWECFLVGVDYMGDDLPGFLPYPWELIN
jgi:hypothetical protein